MSPTARANQQPSSVLTVTWRAVGVSALLVAIAALTGLGIVSSVRNVDTLSVLALVLAILAFVVQLIVFIVQGISSNDAAFRMQELYSSMNTTLAQISEKSAGTQATVTTISDRLLEQALGKAVPEARRQDMIGDDEQDFIRRLTETLTPLLTPVSPANENRTNISIRSEPPTYPERTSIDKAEDERIIKLLSSFPSPNELPEVVSTLQQLNDTELGDLRDLANDEIRSRQPDSLIAPGLVSYGSPKLFDMGLIESSPSNSDLRMLTQKGRQVARLLSAERKEPPYLTETAHDLRARAAEEAIT